MEIVGEADTIWCVADADRFSLQAENERGWNTKCCDTYCNREDQMAWTGQLSGESGLLISLDEESLPFDF